MGDGSIKQRVLVADDERHILRLIQVNLERQGHVVTGVSDGREAIRALEIHDFDLAILDFMMPFVDGYEVLTWIRTHERTANLRVGLMSAQFDPDFNDDRFEHKADFYIRKSNGGIDWW